MQRSFRLDSSVQYCKGVGPKRAELLNRAGVETIEDLLNYYPRRYLDRSQIKNIKDVKGGEEVTVLGQVLSMEVRRGRKKRFVLWIGDSSGMMQCVWFRGIEYISKVFNRGDRVAFSGRISDYYGQQLVHPEYDRLAEEDEIDPLHTSGIIPLYPSTETLSRGGLDSRGFRRILHEALQRLETPVHETLSGEIIERQKLIAYDAALRNIHFPTNWDLFHEAQKRLKFEELFFIQLYLAIQRKERSLNQKGVPFLHVGEQTRRLVEKLPFQFTEAQKRVLREIREDIRSERPMNRLLQGDVGSGKTIVALVTILIAVENGFQATLMAPTEILAEQHFLTTHQWFEDLGVRVALLKGGQKSGERRKVLEEIMDGTLDIAIGTHALVQEGVTFKKLGLVVIDEQHRFGVMQRATLREKGYAPHVLVMTATPIPRTLALTLYGDLDISVIDELPGGRKPVRTVWRKADKHEAIYSFIRDHLREGSQAYIVYPLVEESEKVDLAAATQGYEELSKRVFPEFNVALLHGRMKTEEKDNIMREFKSGAIHMLVCTTVIEVGVDVPNAAVMLLEHAERFGLTQMHQLRGRIGRGKKQSTCILLTYGNLSEDAVTRLKTMEETTDGFRISETDLRLRGPGEFFGTRQHGMLDLKIADLATDGHLISAAREEAFRLVEKDQQLEQSENKNVHDRYRMKYREAFHLLHVG